jgi:hypothetical protein
VMSVDLEVSVCEGVAMYPQRNCWRTAMEWTS